MKIIPKALARWLFKAAGGSSYSFNATDSSMVAAAFGNVSHAGKSVTDETMTQISAVWSCQRILSETIGALPWAIYESDGKGNAKKVDHPLSDVLIDSPNVDMTSVEFKEAKVLGLCQRGNAYSLTDRTSDGTVSSLYPIPSSNVQVKRKHGGNTKLPIADGAVFYSVLDRGKWEPYPRDKIWHVKGFGSGIEGLSPLGAAREAMGFALATQEFGSRFFSQGAKPSFTVTIPNWLEPDQRRQAEAKLQATMTGLANMHSGALFEGGMKPEPWGENSLEDLMFVSLLGFSVLEICRFYRVPPHMVADLSRATFSNIEHLSQEFVMFTLMPYFTRFESSVSKWLLKPSERGRFFLRFNFEGLLRADSQGRAEFYSRMLQNGVYSRNEVRALENQNRVDGLDDYTVQSNMTLVDMLEQLTAAQANKHRK